jgi:hypothetical protein
MVTLMGTAICTSSFLRVSNHVVVGCWTSHGDRVLPARASMTPSLMDMLLLFVVVPAHVAVCCLFLMY